MSETRRIDSIVIGQRTRRGMGDMASLMASIKARGLLHPPAIRPDGTLVAGQRRIEACRGLGWREIPVTVVDTVTDELSALLAEGEENECRQGFTPSEGVEHKRRIEGVIAAAAAERVGGRPSKTSSKLDEVSTPTERRTDTRVAKAVGIGKTTLAKAEKVVDAAESHPDPVVREAAAAAVVEMDRTGRVDPAARVVDAAKSDARIRAMGLDGEALAIEQRRAGLRAAASRASKNYGEGLLALPAAEVADLIREWDLWDALAEQSAKWWADLIAARPRGLRVVGGEH